MRCTLAITGRFAKHPGLLERFRCDVPILEAHDTHLVYADGFTLRDPLKAHSVDLYLTEGVKDILRLALLAVQAKMAKTIRDAIVVAFHHKHLEVCADYGEEPCCGRQYWIPDGVNRKRHSVKAKPLSSTDTRCSQSRRVS